MTDLLQSLTHVTVPSSSGPRAVELRMPSVRRISGLLEDEGLPHDVRRLEQWLPLVLLDFVARLDGRPFRWDRLDDVVADAEFTRGVLLRIRTMLDTLREKGKVFVQCPGCRSWEAEVPMTAYALTIAAPLPSSFDGPFIRSPSLGSRTLLGDARPSLPRTERVRFELPSAHLGLPAPITGGVLGVVEHQPEDHLYDDIRDDDDDEEDDDDDDDRELTDEDIRPNRQRAGWRSVLRLSRAIDPPLSIEEVEKLPAIDLFFLDLVHYVVVLAPVRPDTAGKIRCPNCATVFLPVRPDYGRR